MSPNRAHAYDDEEDSDTSSHYAQWHQGGMPLPVCPKCHSSQIETRNRARKLGGVIGSVSGAAGAMIVAASKARAAAGLLGGPAGLTFGCMASAVAAALASAAASGTTGVKIGEVIDEKILNNYLCHSCGHTFSLKHS